MPLLLRCAAAMAGCVMFGACATTQYGESRMVDAGHPEARPESELSLEVGDLRIEIETLDRAPREAETPQIAVGIAFEPRVLGYSFDPSQVVLRVDGGGEWRTASLPEGYVPLGTGAAFRLAFDTALGPGSTAELVLGGIARGPRLLDPVSLRLSRQSGTSLDRLYWAEAICYAACALIGGGPG